MENFITNAEIYEYPMICRLLTIMLFIPIIAFSQKNDYKSYDKAVSFMKKEKYKKSIEICNKIIKENPSWKAPYLLASKCFEKNNQIIKSAEYLQNSYSFLNNKAYLEIGNLLYKYGFYKEALENFRKIIGEVRNGQFDSSDLNLKIKSCLFSINQLINIYSTNKPIKLNSNVNTSFSEYFPVLSLDDSLLLFTRRVLNKDDIYDEDIYVSKKDSIFWTEASSLGSINSSNNEGAVNLTSDKSTFVFTSCNRREGYGRCDIYFMNSDGEIFNAGPKINTKHWESQACFSPDNKYLYFVSDRPGGFGGKDIWMSELTANGFSSPVNLGSIINTKRDEMTPFIHFDNQTLYFASDGHVGFGNYDIYISRRKNIASMFEKPVNLGPSINSFKEENCFFVSSDGKTAYYSTDRFDNQHDIYTVLINDSIRPNNILSIEREILSSNNSEIILNNIQFETNSFTLINSSFSDIDELISNLKKYENLEIEIQGHTDNVGNYDYNLKLSELRAKSVYNYIVESDSLLVDRITFKGYGEDKPIDDNKTDRGRAINRRTSFLIKNF